MNWGVVGRWVMLGGSLALGVLAGMAGLWIFEFKVPDAVQTSVFKAEARLYYFLAGVLFGFAIYGWTRAAVSIADRAGASRRRRESSASPGAGVHRP